METKLINRAIELTEQGKLIWYQEYNPFQSEESYSAILNGVRYTIINKQKIIEKLIVTDTESDNDSVTVNIDIHNRLLPLILNQINDDDGIRRNEIIERILDKI